MEQVRHLFISTSQDRGNAHDKKKEPAKDKMTRHAIIRPKGKVVVDEENFQKALQEIYILLRSHTNHDFSLYKKNTVIRRVERRIPWQNMPW